MVDKKDDDPTEERPKAPPKPPEPPASFPDNHFAQAVQYLADRGVTPDMYERVGIELQPAAKWYVDTYKNSTSKDRRIAIKYNHFDTHGKQIEFNTVRFINPPMKGLTFAAAAGEKDKRTTRSVKKGALLQPYLCPLNDWREFKEGQRIYICESVLKAINVAAFGHHAIGLNGVSAISSARHKVDLLAEIVDLPWAKLNLQPIILFDSDYDKPDITKAYTTLATKLAEYHQTPVARLLKLPPPPPGWEKDSWGFDDARRELTDEWAKKFLKTKGTKVKPDDVLQGLYKLNEEFAYVKSVQVVIDLNTGNMMTESRWKGGYVSNRIAFAVDGSRVKLPQAWLEWKLRHDLDDVEYMPGGDPLHDGKYNLWSGMGVEPAEGSVEPFLDVLNNNIRDDAERKYFIQWCAYPVQNLGAKMMVSPVLVGKQGLGKSLIGQALGAVYGRANYKEVARDDIESDFNSGWVQSQFVVIEEMHSERKAGRQFMSRLKKIITSDQNIVKKKHIQEYTIANHTNFLFTTNDADSMAFEGRDRRFFVAHFKPVVDYYRNPGYWNKFVAWLHGAGPAALHHYLLNVDLEGFDPGAPAPETSYKAVMEDAALGGPEAFVRDLWNDEVELPSDRVLWTTTELAQICDPDARSFTGLGSRLKPLLDNRGFERANEDKSVGDRKIKKTRYYIIRDRANPDWQLHAPCLKHLKKHITEIADKY